MFIEALFYKNMEAPNIFLAMGEYLIKLCPFSWQNIIVKAM